MRTRRCACLLLIASAWAAQPTGAQLIQGRVLDAGTRQPVALVTVRLLRADVQIGEALTDSAGRFVLQPRGPGRYRLHAMHIGYADATTRYLELQNDQSIAAELLISRQPVRIAPLAVEASRSPYLDRKGFYERMTLRMGDYLTGDQIRRRNFSSLIDILRSMRGVKVQRLNSRQEPYMSGTNCLPMILVDGVTMRWGARFSATLLPLEDVAQVTHIEGIEVYRGGGHPPEFDGPNSACGVILIWTRHS